MIVSQKIYQSYMDYMIWMVEILLMMNPDI